jgi:hypothetical protein
MRPLLARLLLTALPLVACENGDGGYVPYVPAPGFAQRMEVTLELPDSAPVAVGAWVTMHATRESGPWVLRDSTMTEEPACEEISPITQEYEVAGKVEWRVEPEGRVNYSVPGPPNFDRQIRFNQPGRYRVWAVSDGCGAEFESNRVEVTVR